MLAQRPTFILINDPQAALRAQVADEQSYFWLPLSTPPDFPILLLVRSDRGQQAAQAFDLPLRPADDPAMDRLLSEHRQERMQQALGLLYDRFCQPAGLKCQVLWLLLRP